jgi:hypothetical protein
VYTGVYGEGMRARVRLRIEEWQIDDGNLSELADHGATGRTVHQVWRGEPRYRPNRKKNRAATHEMVGLDRGGKMWVIFIKEVNYQPGLWRPITGWEAEGPDKEWYRRNK